MNSHSAAVGEEDEKSTSGKATAEETVRPTGDTNVLIRKKDGHATFEQEIVAFGEERTVDKKVPREDFDDFAVYIDVSRPITLSELDQLIQVEFDRNANPREVYLDFSSVDAISTSYTEAPIETPEENEADERTGVEKETDHEDSSQLNLVDGLPPIPHVDEFEAETKEMYYKRLKSEEESQPSVMRRIIYENEGLTQGELKELMEEAGYNSTSSGFGNSLRMLDDVTDEIERKGRGDSQVIRWTGN